MQPNMMAKCVIDTRPPFLFHASAKHEVDTHAVAFLHAKVVLPAQGDNICKDKSIVNTKRIKNISRSLIAKNV